MTGWKNTEEKILSALYPRAPWDEILAALPRHDKQSIRSKGYSLRIRRGSKGDMDREDQAHPLVELLRQHRIDRKMSKGKLAAEMDIDRSSIIRWESGSTIPRLDMIVEWARVLGLTVELTANMPVGYEGA